ncbi:MAG: hypothetical protein ACHQT8_02735 [Chlamydiales bacterium]
MFFTRSLHNADYSGLCCINPFFNTEHTESTEQKEGGIAGWQKDHAGPIICSYLGVLGVLGGYFFRFMQQRHYSAICHRARADLCLKVPSLVICEINRSSLIVPVTDAALPHPIFT